jgi:hydrogenase nickel incorporation protein HypA/HybF
VKPVHELAVAQALIEQVGIVARNENASRVEVIHVGIGPLSGVEAHLLEQAYPIAAAHSIAATARLVIEQLPVRVNCRQCGSVTEAPANRLVCGSCGDWRTTLIAGDELQLTSVELTREADDRTGSTAARAAGEAIG